MLPLMDIDDDDIVSILDSTASILSPKVKPSGTLHDHEQSPYPCEMLEAPSEYLGMTLLAVLEPWSILQSSLFRLLPPACISGITHIVHTVTATRQTIWLAAASIEAAVMLRGYLVDQRCSQVYL